jgi:anti-sigma-K factor RskA
MKFTNVHVYIESDVLYWMNASLFVAVVVVVAIVCSICIANTHQHHPTAPSI